MTQTSPVIWEDVPSPLDGIRCPSVTIADGGMGYLALVVSECFDLGCQAMFTVDFDRPEAFSALEESICSIARPAEDVNAAYVGPVYLKRTQASDVIRAIAPTVNMMSGRTIDLWHYLLVGMGDCLEVVTRYEPIVRRHPSFDAALTWARRSKRGVA
jgi:hypothetical protein